MHNVRCRWSCHPSLYLFGVLCLTLAATPFPSSSSSDSIFVHERYNNIINIPIASIHCFLLLLLFLCVCVCTSSIIRVLLFYFRQRRVTANGVNAPHHVVAEEYLIYTRGSFPTSHLTDACVPVVIYHHCKASKRILFVFLMRHERFRSIILCRVYPFYNNILIKYLRIEQRIIQNNFSRRNSEGNRGIKAIIFKYIRTHVNYPYIQDDYNIVL